MKEYPKRLEIPYYSVEKKINKTIQNSSATRNMSVVFFILRKIKNIILYRLTFFCPINQWRIKMHRWRGVSIGNNVFIGIQCSIDNAYPEFVFIEDNVSIVNETTIIAHSNPMNHFKNILPSYVAPVIIKSGAWIGIKSIILPGVTIGTKSVVSAGSVVTKDVKAFSLVAGNPAVTKVRYEEFI